MRRSMKTVVVVVVGVGCGRELLMFSVLFWLNLWWRSLVRCMAAYVCYVCWLKSCKFVMPLVD
jgi:hypothetical protein